jgi:hypothetical protein
MCHYWDLAHFWHNTDNDGKKFHSLTHQSQLNY